MLKKKLKIPSTHLIQTSELTNFEKEKEALNTELTDFKAKILKLEEKEKQWEVDAKILIEREKDLRLSWQQRKNIFRKSVKNLKVNLQIFLKKQMQILYLRKCTRQS